MKTLKVWLTETIISPVSGAVISSVRASNFHTRRKIAELSGSVETLESAVIELTSELSEVLESLRDNRNEHAILASNILAPDQDGEYGADDNEFAIAEMNDRIDTLQSEMVQADMDIQEQFEDAIDQDVLADIIESFEIRVVR